MGNSEQTSRQQKRKKEQEKAIEKIKASKKFKKNKPASDDEDDVALAIYEAHAAPLPGQMENCDLCRARFTVTAYSRAGPSGGLLCKPCSKELEKEDFAAQKKAKLTKGRGAARRKMQSNILDGTYRTGAQSLMTLCIKTLAQNIKLADELGDLPPTVVDKIARELSKHRLLDSQSIKLFLRPGVEDIRIYDGARLTQDDLISVFQFVPDLKTLKIRNGIQFKDGAMEFLISRHINLEQLYLHGSNLVSEKMWIKFFENKGQSLRSLRVYFTDKHFGDSSLTLLPTYCPNLQCLKVRHNQEVTADGVKAVASLPSLKKLGLHLKNTVHSDVFVYALDRIGLGLETLSLSTMPTLDNTILDALHFKCRSLSKLRITDSHVMTNEGFTRLFKDWENPGLTFIDFQKCRHLDAVRPRDNPNKIGLCSDGFRALMAHSGKTLKHLNIHACRHVSREAFEEVFALENKYPHLISLEISFCEEVNDFIVGCIFRTCPELLSLIHI